MYNFKLRGSADPGGRGLIRRFSMLAAVLVAAAAAAHPGWATDQMYTLQSPNFGGNNPASLSAAQYAQGLVQQNKAAAAAATAAAAAKATDSTSQQFANAIISQLNAMVARSVALQISGALPGQGGTIQSGGVTITYVNVDGQLNVSITTPTGTTTLAMPSGN